MVSQTVVLCSWPLNCKLKKNPRKKTKTEIWLFRFFIFIYLYLFFVESAAKSPINTTQFPLLLNGAPVWRMSRHGERHTYCCIDSTVYRIEKVNDDFPCASSLVYDLLYWVLTNNCCVQPGPLTCFLTRFSPNVFCSVNSPTQIPLPSLVRVSTLPWAMWLGSSMGAITTCGWT